jgi:tRNA(adenine34) deaminase
MCMGAIIWCGISRVVFGASIAQLATKIGRIMMTNAEVADRLSFADVGLTGGALAEESLKLFK